MFDSRKEAERYIELKFLSNQKRILDFQLQPKFLLLDGFKDFNGKKHLPIYYISDFMYREVNKPYWTVEDVKGVKTEAYKIKKKLFLQKYPNYKFIES